MARPVQRLHGMARAIGYVRVSTDKQADSGLSLEAQRAKIVAYAAAMDVELVGVIVETASAKGLGRTGLSEALAALESGRADAILVTKLDRLTRSVRDLGELIERYFASRFALLSVGDSIDTRSAAGRLVLNVLASVGQWEREAIGERTRDAIAAKRARGERIGPPPASHDQAALDRARALRASGTPLQAIAAQLGSEGYAVGSGHCSGATWSRSAVARMLSRAA